MRDLEKKSIETITKKQVQGFIKHLTSMEGILNNLITSIEELNVEESIYWAHLLKQQQQQSNVNLTILNELFKGFKLENEELSLILSNLIWEILKNEDFPAIFEKYHRELIEGLIESKDENVLKLCLRIIFELGIKNCHEIDEILIKESLKLLLTTNYSISSYLIELLTSITIDNQIIISKELLNLYSKLSIEDSVIKFRFFELYSKTSHSTIHSHFPFFDEIKMIISRPNEDPLMTANIIQIIQDCITRREQFQLFLSEGIIDLLLKLIENQNSTISCKSLDFLSNCAILKCFDYDFIELNSLDRRILTICEEDEIKKVSGVFCLATFSILSRNPQNLLSKFEDFLFHGISSVQLSALNGIGIYFKSINNDLSNHDSSAYVNNLSSKSYQFEFLINLNSKGFFIWLIEKINSTFIEEKSSAYFTLNSILSCKENLKFVLDNSTIFSILLQRNLDDSSIGLKWKYGILEQIYLNSDLFNSLNDPLKEQVKKYLGQGVTFIPKSSRVTFEAAE
jgi:hypothetical protein